jgi:hypothetical protein
MTDRTRTVRSTTALIAAAALALASAGVLVVATTEPADAANLTFTTGDADYYPRASAIIEGTSDPGDTVTVSGSILVQDCVTIAVGGVWQCEVEFARSDYTSISASNGIDGDSLEVRVLLPPEVDAPAYGELTNDRTPTFSGRGYPGGPLGPAAEVRVMATESTPYCVTTVLPDGSWSCTSATDLPDGDYGFGVVQDVGLGETDPAFVEFTVDSIGPSDAPIISFPVDSTGPRTLPDPNEPPFGSTSEARPTINGVGEPGAFIRLWTGSSIAGFSEGPFCNATAGADGRWSCQLGPYPVGASVVVYSTQDDAAGNSGPSPDPEIRINIVAPPGPVTVTTPAPGYRAVNPYVYVSGPPAGNPVTVTDGEGSVCTVVTTASGWSCTIGPLSPREYNFGVFATDIYGTSSPGTSIEFEILAPTPPATPTPTATPSPTATAPPLPIAVQLTVTDLEGNDITGQPIVAGQTVVLTATGLPTGSTVTAELHSDPIVLGTKSVGDDGMFTMTSVIPRTVPPGDHNFVVAVEAPGYAPTTVQTAVPILAPPPEKATEQVDKEAVLALLAAEEEALRTGDFTAPTSFTNTLQTVADVRITATTLGVAGLVASAFLLLVAFPAELLEGTIRANYRRLFWWMDPVSRRFAKVREVAAARINRWVGTIGIIAGTAVVLGFADPGFGVNGASLRLWIALVVSIVLLNVVVSSIVMSVAERRFRIGSTLEPMPAALLLVAASVIVSRLAGIQPGLLFSIVLGIAFAYELSRRQDALLTLLGVGLSIAIGVAAWLGYSALAATGGDDPGFWHLLAQEILAATTVEALATMVIALLPLDFLDGKSLFQWNKWAWAGVYVVAIVTFVIIILPLANNWGEATAPFLGWGALFGGFAAFAVLAWALLRFIPARGDVAADNETVEREKIDA